MEFWEHYNQQSTKADAKEVLHAFYTKNPEDFAKLCYSMDILRSHLALYPKGTIIISPERSISPVTRVLFEETPELYQNHCLSNIPVGNRVDSSADTSNYLGTMPTSRIEKIIEKLVRPYVSEDGHIVLVDEAVSGSRIIDIRSAIYNTFKDSNVKIHTISMEETRRTKPRKEVYERLVAQGEITKIPSPLVFTDSNNMLNTLIEDSHGERYSPMPILPPQIMVNTTAHILLRDIYLLYKAPQLLNETIHKWGSYNNKPRVLSHVNLFLHELQNHLIAIRSTSIAKINI